MEFKVYTPAHKEEWDSFVRTSKNGTFLFCRDFMEYHGDRFNDYSLLFYRGGKLIALLPGHIEDKVFCTHKGLTYGGIITNNNTRMADVLAAFELLTTTLRHQGIRQIIYKAIPHIYHRQPAEEDLYALFLHKAVLTERNISSTVCLPHRTAYSELRKRGIAKAIKNGLHVEKAADYSDFWQILDDNLQARYGKHPVHSLAEITLLKESFPDEIHLFTVKDTAGNTVAGCLIFEMPNVVHVQYIAASEEGKNKGAVDLVIDYILSTAYPQKTYFDYGTSNENNGLYLNKHLIRHKEGFGARGTVYDIYTINL